MQPSAKAPLSFFSFPWPLFSAHRTRNNGLPLIAPRITPVLDPFFRPAVLANHAFQSAARASHGSVPVRLALEQADGSVSRFDTVVLAGPHPECVGNFTFLARLVKFLLWSR